jgi:hypothetical protein
MILYVFLMQPADSYKQHIPPHTSLIIRNLRSSFVPILVYSNKFNCVSLFQSFGFFLWGETKSLGIAATSGLLYKPQMIDECDCGAIGGMKIGRGKRSTRRKPAQVPLCPPQNPT